MNFFQKLFFKEAKGVIYTVIGDEIHTQNAIISAQSLKKHNVELPITLFCDKRFDTINYTVFDNVVKIEREPYIWANRMKAMLISPYKKTLYLDADSYILDDIEEMFTVLNKFDYAISHGGNRIKRHYNAIKNGVINQNIPYAFAPVGGGVQLIHKNRKTKCFLKNLLKKSIEKNYFDDQVSIREQLWDNPCKLKFYILPMEYRVGQIAFIELWSQGINSAMPKILFYTQKKNGPDYSSTLNKAINITKDLKKLKEFYNNDRRKE